MAAWLLLASARLPLLQPTPCCPVDVASEPELASRACVSLFVFSAASRKTCGLLTSSPCHKRCGFVRYPATHRSMSRVASSIRRRVQDPAFESRHPRAMPRLAVGHDSTSDWRLMGSSSASAASASPAYRDNAAEFVFQIGSTGPEPVRDTSECPAGPIYVAGIQPLLNGQQRQSVTFAPARRLRDRCTHPLHRCVAIFGQALGPILA